MGQVLLVDDEENILSGFRRSLRGKFEIDTASNGADALRLIAAQRGYAVVVSDMRMPAMTGVELFMTLKVKWPHTVRVLLTGNTDQRTAIQAINDGDVFRFLNKPCTPEQLCQAITAALEHHQLLTAERDLLESTLRGSITMLVELLSLVRPDAFGQTMRVKHVVRDLGPLLGIADSWVFETATLLAQVGYATLSPELVESAQAGRVTLTDERVQLDAAVDLSAGLIAKIARLQPVAEIVRHQECSFDGVGNADGAPQGTAIPLGARMLRCAIDYDRFISQGEPKSHALALLVQQSSRYDPAVLRALIELVGRAPSMVERLVAISGLTPHMVLAEDVFTFNNAKVPMLLICKGQEVTDAVHAHLLRYFKAGTIGERVRVFEPA